MYHQHSHNQKTSLSYHYKILSRQDITERWEEEITIPLIYLLVLTIWKVRVDIYCVLLILYLNTQTGKVRLMLCRMYQKPRLYCTGIALKLHQKLRFLVSQNVTLSPPCFESIRFLNPFITFIASSRGVLVKGVYYLICGRGWGC